MSPGVVVQPILTDFLESVIWWLGSRANLCLGLIVFFYVSFSSLLVLAVNVNRAWSQWGSYRRFQQLPFSVKQKTIMIEIMKYIINKYRLKPKSTN